MSRRKKNGGWVFIKIFCWVVLFPFMLVYGFFEAMLKSSKKRR